MLTRIKQKNIVNDEVFNHIVSKLKNKLKLFDYITEDQFINAIKEENYLIYVSEHAIFPCEVLLYSTGLKALAVNVVKLSSGTDEIEHLKECLSILEEEAKRLDFDRVVLEGRLGWKRLFPEYNVERIVLTKDIKE